MKASKHIGKVSISVVCVILGILLALQFKSVRENNQIRFEYDPCADAAESAG